MNQAVRRKLDFFKDCLEAENRSQVVWNFPTTKSEHVQAFPNVRDELAIQAKYHSKVDKTLAHYHREKRLLLSAFFLQGSFKVPSFAGTTRTRNIKCPIFTFVCELSASRFNSDNAILVDLQRANINPAAAQILEYFSLDPDKYLQPLLFSLIKEKELNFQVERTNRLLNDLSKASDRSMTLSTSCYASVERKQASAQGSLYELETLSDRRRFSPPLMSILKEGASVKPSFWTDLSVYWPFRRSETPLPEVLSDAQTRVLDSAGKYPLSVVSGPPGTGKSFTIACLALREFSKGKSVLVVSQNQHAVDVVRRKLIDQMGIEAGLTVLGSEQGVSPGVKAQIKLMLAMDSYEHRGVISQTNQELKRLTDERVLLESEFNAEVDALTQTNCGNRKSVFWSSGFWKFGRNKRTTENELLFNKFLRLEEIDEQIRQLIARLMTAYYQETAQKLAANTKSRQSLDVFAKSLTARNQHYQENYYEQVNFEHVLKAIPFWFCSVGNLHRLLPMQRELFDLVVIDEATQCNMSVCLPALQRAKRAVIVGDPKQLKHVSFVSFELQQRLAVSHGLNSTEISDNFRGSSVLDYAQSACEIAEQSTMLDEHFRSHPQIIQFCNNEFYQDRLKVMTERPTNRQRSIEVLTIKGKRLNKGINKQEADAVLQKLKLIIKEQRRLPETDVHTVGVLAFFSEQSSHIEKMVFDRISLNDMRRHNIRVGTPFSFQGEERDHMLISCSVDSQTSGNAYTYLNRDDVFNVAVTRARDFQTLFISTELEGLKAGSKLKSYLKYVNEYQYHVKSSSDSAHDEFQSEICNWLSKRGVDVYKNYLVAGISIDIMAVFHGHAVAIDLIGFEGDCHGALSLTQFKLLQRAGLESFLLPYPEWRQQAEQVLQALMLRLGAAHDLPEAGRALDKFSDEHDVAFRAIANGLSINELNARFMRNEEVVAAEQLTGLIGRYQRFVELLNANFIPQELTFKRYLNALNELVADCLSNLQKASVSAELANSMFEQQKALYGDARFNNEFDDVIAARLSMVDEQRAKLKRLLGQNEKALLQIDKTIFKLNSLSNDESNIDPLEALKELSARLDLYRGKTLTKE